MIKNFTFDLLGKEDLDKTLELRNQDETRASSLNSDLITRDEHYSYFDNLTKTDFYHYYVLRYNKQFIGVGYGKDFDQKNKSCTWGFFKDLNIKSEIKFGKILKFFLFEKLFSKNIVDQLTCQVLKENEWLKDWYIRWGHTLINYNDKQKFFNLRLLKKDWKKISKEKYSELFLYKKI
jgi:UDP-4-amino-4,6-dideoxy-N-acetyl-beta-L-altrosamine N-acetyltransferase